MLKDLIFILFLFTLLSCQRVEEGLEPTAQAGQKPIQGKINSDSQNTPSHSDTSVLPPGAHSGASASMPPVMQRITEYKERLEKNPDDLEALIFLGNANYDIQRFEKAEEYYQRALEVDQHNTHVRTDLASSYRQLGNTDASIAELRRVLAQDSNQEIALYNLGVILLNDKEDFEGTTRVWKKLVAIYRAKEAKYSSLNGDMKAFIKAFGGEMAKGGEIGKIDVEQLAQVSGITPAEYHQWLKEDPLFSEALRNVKDSLFAEELEIKIKELENGEPLRVEG